MKIYHTKVSLHENFQIYGIYLSLLSYNTTIVAIHLSDKDHADILYKVRRHAASWRDIGRALGFKQGEMNNIQSNPMLTASAPSSYLEEMLTQWLEWAPGDRRGSKGFATTEALRVALLKANLGQLAQQ